LIAEDLAGHVDLALGTLSPREREVLRLRFGLGHDEEHTLGQIGARFSVTRERIRQIEAEALRKLRRLLRGRHLQAIVKP